ncbi:cytochrome b-245 heavy chain-like [Xenia sp. Carnegie-2017]|uniref:cytochrome b-245 heavy chain-like n=1 Tax=Xenia sp. Carnegie-2017 TaxID=2897299 RepID=UPI001F03AA59|nr:cytochrome b-245 heavy chain-like [Xenia sp. Carnegie-2017]
MGRNLQHLLDKNITFHRVIAYVICFFTTIHIGTHLFNFESLIDAYGRDSKDLRFHLSDLGDSGNDTYINPIRKQAADPPTEVFKTGNYTFYLRN